MLETVVAHPVVSSLIGLGTLGPILGLAGKTFLEGPCYAHILEGNEALVHEYCKLDTLTTLLLFLVWIHHRGDLTVGQLRDFVATIRDADMIVVMDKGRVVDQGTHDDLIAREGAYAALYQLQFRDAAAQ